MDVAALTEAVLPELAELYGVKGGEERAADLATALAGLHEQVLRERAAADEVPND